MTEVLFQIIKLQLIKPLQCQTLSTVDHLLKQIHGNRSEEETKYLNIYIFFGKYPKIETIRIKSDIFYQQFFLITLLRYIS